MQTLKSKCRREITAIGPYATAIHLDRNDQSCQSRWQRRGSRFHVLRVRGSHAADVNDLGNLGQEAHRIEARASAGGVRQHGNSSPVPRRRRV